MSCSSFENMATADDGDTLILDTKGKEDSDGLSTEDVACVLNSLDVPDAVLQHIDTTRALDGQQTDSWSGVDARWTYHPDDGLDITLRISQ